MQDIEKVIKKFATEEAVGKFSEVAKELSHELDEHNAEWNDDVLPITMVDNFDTEDGTIEANIEFFGPSALFNLYGTGVHHNRNPISRPPDVGDIGTYGNRQGLRDSGWFFYDSQDELRFTRGQPAFDFIGRLERRLSSGFK